MAHCAKEMLAGDLLTGVREKIVHDTNTSVEHTFQAYQAHRCMQQA